MIRKLELLPHKCINCDCKLYYCYNKVMYVYFKGYYYCNNCFKDSNVKKQQKPFK